MLGGVDTLDPLLLPRGAALPMELLAVAWLLRGRSVAAFALVGAAVCVHAPSAAACAAGMAVAVAPQRDATRSARQTGAFVAAASPVVIGWIVVGGPSAPIVDDAWAVVLDRRLAHHLDPAVWPVHDLAVTAAFGGLGLLTARLAAVRWFLAGCALYGVAGVALGRAGSALALQLEPAQVARLVVLVGAVTAASRVRLDLSRWWLLGAVAMALAVGRWSPDGDRAHFRPGGPDGPEQALARQIAQLDPDSLIVVPAHRFAEVRVLGQRPVFVTWKDGGEALFDRSRALEWKRRIEASCACRPLDEPLEAGLGPGERGAEIRRRIGDGTWAASRDELIAVARREGATHLVVEITDGFELIDVR